MLPYTLFCREARHLGFNTKKIRLLYQLATNALDNEYSEGVRDPRGCDITLEPTDALMVSYLLHKFNLKLDGGTSPYHPVESNRRLYRVTMI